MLSGAVARVEDRSLGCIGRFLCRADLWVAQNDDVRVPLDGLDRVAKRFAAELRDAIMAGSALFDRNPGPQPADGRLACGGVRRRCPG